FPGYIFIETSAIGEISSILKFINGSSGFVRTKSGDIHPLKDNEVTEILKIEDAKLESVEEIHLKVHDEVRIADGPFTTFKGRIIEVLSDKQKVKVEVLIFGRQTSIELNYDQVERIY